MRLQNNNTTKNFIPVINNVAAKESNDVNNNSQQIIN